MSNVDLAPLQPGPQTADVELELWSKAYPQDRLGNPRDVEKAWVDLRVQGELPALDELLATLAWQVESDEWKKQAGKFCPFAENYLRKRRFRDQQPEAPPPQNGGRAPRFDPSKVPVPPELAASAEFLEAWKLRCRERMEPGRTGSAPSQSSIEGVLSDLAKLAKARGMAAAIACVNRAKTGRHQGVVYPEDFEPKGYGRKQEEMELPLGATPALMKRLEEWGR